MEGGQEGTTRGDNEDKEGTIEDIKEGNEGTSRGTSRRTQRGH